MTERNLSIIVAMDKNRLIGRQNRLPWSLPEDLKHFRQKTLEHNVIMGKNTWLSLGRALDGRTNIVLSRDPHFAPAGVIVCHSVVECLNLCSGQECFVIGGAQVFALFLPFVNKMYITHIEAEFEGDTWFPDYDPAQWETVYYESLVSRNGLRLNFTEYQRLPQGGNHAEPC